MSGQEEQSPQDINNVDHQVDNDSYDSYERFANLLMLASAPASDSRSRMVLDYMYGNGISLVPIPIPIPMNGAVAGGGALDGLYDFESAAASILGRSLYDRCPVKNVITDEACDEIVDRKFTSAMVEDLKINGTCGIWQEDFKEGEDIKILPCNHAFNAGAILKWLREEKAECPMCRLSLRSKEVIPPQLQNLENSGHEQAHQDPDEAHAEAPQQDNPVVRVNNIAYRLAESVAGRVNQHHHHHHHHDHDHHSISVPMNRLLQNIRMSSSSLRLREPVRAAAPSSGGAADIGREVHAEAIQHNIEPANHHIINNYYLHNINNIIRYNRNNDNNDNRNNDNNDNRNNYDNRNNNNNNNYDNDDERNAADREQADIEEAIRRSLQQY
jgi:hypothetical protein